jgi:hypothetical protein
MTIVATGRVDEAQRTLFGLPDLTIAMDTTTNRLLAYTLLAAQKSDPASVRSASVGILPASMAYFLNVAPA